MTNIRYEDAHEPGKGAAGAARVALLGLDAREETVWHDAAGIEGAEAVVAKASGECAAYAGLNIPLVVVAQTGPAFEPRLADPNDPILGSIPLIVVSRDLHEQALWSVVAWDALLGPVKAKDACQAIAEATNEARRRLEETRVISDFRRRHASLSDAERPVYSAVCDGRLNKQIASELGVSVRTVEQRRRRVFEKMGVESAVPLAAMAATVRALSAQARRCRRQANSAKPPSDAEPSGKPRPATKPPSFAGLLKSKTVAAIPIGG